MNNWPSHPYVWIIQDKYGTTPVQAVSIKHLLENFRHWVAIYGWAAFMVDLMRQSYG